MFFPRYSPTSVRSRNEVVFWCFAIFMLLLFLGRNALWGLEGRSAEVVREMLFTGNFFNPQINGISQNARLPLSYWIHIPGSSLFGANEFILRLPAVIAGVVLLFATRMIARKLFDAETALIAMWVLLSTYGFIFWARVVAPDMANAAAAACAVCCYLYWKDIPDFKDYLFFYLLLGIGSLFKGVPVVAVTFLFILPHVWSRGNFKRYCSWQHAVALLLGVAAGLLPFWFFGSVSSGSSAGNGMDILWYNQILRILDARYSGEPVYCYLYELPRILLPWSAVFVVGFILFIIKRKELTPEFNALLTGMVLVFILFSFSGSRSWYYLLPLVPFCSIVTAAVLNGYAGESKVVDWILELMFFVLLGAASLALALPIALPLQGVIFKYHIPFTVVVSCFIAGLAVVTLLIFDRSCDNGVARFFAMPPRIAGLTAGMAAAVTVMFCAVIPSLTVFRSEKPFALELKKELEGINPDNIFFYDKSLNARVLFYLEAARNVQCGTDIAEFICRNAGKRVAVISEDGRNIIDNLENDISRLEPEVMNVDDAHLQEKHLFHDPAGKEKLRAWIFDVPLNIKEKQHIENNKGAKNE